MTIDVLMPALSPTMEEGTLAKWHVKEGDKVKSGDVIAEIETDKATMEVEAVDEGVVEALLVPEGTEGVKVNAPIARLNGEGAGAPPPAPPPAAEGRSAQAARGAEGRRPRRRQAPPRRRRQPPPPAAKAPDGGERVFASPLARRIAEQKGVDLAASRAPARTAGSSRRDVEGAQPGQARRPAAAPRPSRGAPRRPPPRARSSRWSRWASRPAATTSSRSTACARPSRGG